MPDWKKIRAEYISTGISYRKLAEKYGVTPSVLYRQMAKENWVDLRKQTTSKAIAKTVESVASKEASYVDRITTVADKILNLIEAKVNSAEAVAYPGQELRFLSMSLKDIAQVKGYKTELDLKEQQARIAKLEKEAKQDEQNKDIRVVIATEAEEYAK